MKQSKTSDENEQKPSASVTDKYQKYMEEYMEDSKLEAFTLNDKLMKIPSIKAKYVVRLIQHKREIGKLENLLDDAMKKIMEKYEKSSDIALSKVALENKAKTDPLIKEIKQNLFDERLIVEFFNRAIETINVMGFDAKNLIEWSKMEIQ